MHSKNKGQRHEDADPKQDHLWEPTNGNNGSQTLNAGNDGSARNTLNGKAPRNGRSSSSLPRVTQAYSGNRKGQAQSHNGSNRHESEQRQIRSGPITKIMRYDNML